MEKYYRHFKGGLYRLIGFAKDSENQDDLVVYQALYGENQMWVRPKRMFFEKVERGGRSFNRFEEIKEDEIPLSLNPKYHFPTIEHTNQKLPLTNGEFSKAVKAMITLLQRRGIVNSGFFDGFHSDDDLEAEALRRINEYEQGKELERIFHLIQTWGGISGRGIYVRGNGFNWSTIEPAYVELIKACLSTQGVNDESISKLVSAVARFNKQVRNLGVSFITKHTRFWLHKTLGEFNALPIYDRIMATKLMGKNEARIKDLAEYWKVMYDKKESLTGVSLASLERQVFLCYLNPKTSRN